jgi:hypothetical protein
MKAGEFTSVREAARAAGIVKQTSLVQQVLHLWQKATPEERQMMMWLYSTGHMETRNSRSLRGVFDEPTHDEKISRRV